MAKCFDVFSSQAAGALDLNDLLIPRPASTFFMKMEGDALQGEGIFDGDLLVVDRSIRPAKGALTVVAADGELLVRKHQSTPLRQQTELWGTVTAVVRRFV